MPRPVRRRIADKPTPCPSGIRGEAPPVADSRGTVRISTRSMRPTSGGPHATWVPLPVLPAAGDRPVGPEPSRQGQDPHQERVGLGGSDAGRVPVPPCEGLRRGGAPGPDLPPGRSGHADEDGGRERGGAGRLAAA